MILSEKTVHLQTTTNYVVVCKYKHVRIDREKQIRKVG